MPYDQAMFVSPIYIDIDLIRELLDYFDLEVPEATDVEQVSSDDRGRRIGGGKVPASTNRVRRTETREAFTSTASPARLVSVTLDAAIDELIDLDRDPKAGLVHHGLLTVTGDLQSSNVSNIPQLIRTFAPMFAATTSDDGAGVSDAAKVQMMFGSGSPPTMLTMALPGGETLAMIVREDWLQSGRSMDDLEGDLTVVGHIERIIGEGSSIELDKYLLPGLNRPMRRMLKSQGKLEGMFEDAPSGLAITTEDLSLAGPAVFLRPAAIYP